MNLPSELIHESLSYCSLTDLAIVSRTSTTYQDIAETWLYRSIPILKPENLIICLATIEHRPKIALHIRELSLGSQLGPTLFEEGSSLHRVLQWASNIKVLAIRAPTRVASVFVGCSFNLVSLLILECHMEIAFRMWMSTQSNLTAIYVIPELTLSGLLPLFTLDYAPLHIERLRNASIPSSLAAIFLPHNQLIGLAITFYDHTNLDLTRHKSVPPTIAYLVVKFTWRGIDDWDSWTESITAIVSSLPILAVLRFDFLWLDDASIDKVLAAIPGIMAISSNLRLIAFVGVNKSVPVDEISKWHHHCPCIQFVAIIHCGLGPSQRFARMGDCWFENEGEASMSLGVMAAQALDHGTGSQFEGVAENESAKEVIGAYFESVNIVGPLLERDEWLEEWGV